MYCFMLTCGQHAANSLQTAGYPGESAGIWGSIGTRRNVIDAKKSVIVPDRLPGLEGVGRSFQKPYFT